MYNPSFLKARVFRQKNRGKGYYKRYYPCFSNPVGGIQFLSRRYYKTATEAKNRADTILTFWKKLYDKINKIQTSVQNTLGDSLQSGAPVSETERGNGGNNNASGTPNGTLVVEHLS
jgi:hypothetical protein